MKNQVLITISAICLFVLPVLSCTNIDTGTAPVGTTITSAVFEPSKFNGLPVLEKNEFLWHSSGINNYSFILEIGRFRPPQTAYIRVTVINGAETSFEVITPHDTDYTEVLAKYGTIDRIFDSLRQSYQNEDYTTEAEYDHEYGFPAFLDAYRNVLDFSFAVYISDFQPANP